MTLLAYATLVAAAATRLLRRSWTSRAPRLAIALWQLALVTVMVTTTLALLVLTVPLAAQEGLAGLLHACVIALRAEYRGTPSERPLFMFGLGLASALLLRIGTCLISELWRASRQRHRHLEQLLVVGRPNHQLGATVVDDARAAAYCVPGRGHRIVLTTAALAKLDEEQLAGILAHERAHLVGRHHLVLASVWALARAVPIPMCTTAATEVANLIEMLADDSARTPSQRLSLAAALVNIATGGSATTPAVMAAGNTAVVARVHRLLRPAQPLPRWITLVTTAAAIVIAAVPFAVALGPAAVAAAATYCPVGAG